jgi:hypothetical protein
MNCYLYEQAKPRFHGKSVYSVPAKKIQEEIMTYGASEFRASDNTFYDFALEADLGIPGPVEVAFTVFADFLTYKSGVYKHVAVSLLLWLVVPLCAVFPSCSE